ncbi:hypothetical protein FAM21834_01570 [Lentilactobacillus parabuchneri]|uniref:DUF3899 domain-containing protein n=2 Tax=Lentilactobacillus parabuchneri TaxID=152331 RepID=A0A1X1FE93_9LACO|nr:hypothetical protein [Lentilactobacillus parabuchneri]APR07684.1 hypothetical protein FAM21731_01510 [Lentilactobacillus parabuchneri]MBW0222847.1 hypothetical protein [Lentilactobacillus parabuchneri]MBW0246051.1 hypothetical protein [Lentilactobacillus parabuchneri]MBW0263977.1 hypothetical protein [Lentilactobacillus parabuchneri]MCT2884160.1 hypothetical protein [Lentilactobacillus parabuchneri]
MKTKNMILLGFVVCLALLFFSVKLFLAGTVLLFAWAAYLLIVKKDFTILTMTPSDAVKNPSELDPQTMAAYQLKAYRAGWIVLVIAVGILVFLIVEIVM